MKIDFSEFGDESPVKVTNGPGLDEDNAIQHFEGKTRTEIDYDDSVLYEDLLYLNDNAFIYFLPGYMEASLQGEDADLASATLSAISNRFSGPRVDRLQLSHAQRKIILEWLSVIEEMYGEDEVYTIAPIVHKYRKRIETASPP